MRKSGLLVLGSAVLLIAAYLLVDGRNFVSSSFSSSSCQIQKQGAYFILSQACVRTDTLPKLSLQETVDAVRDDIIGFQDLYDTGSQSFSYQGTQPIFKTSEEDLLSILQKADPKQEKIVISRKQLARHSIQKFIFYVADKDISQLGKCSKTNYLLALSSVDHLLLQPGATFNLNQKLIHLQGYCSGLSGEDRMFYGGVCGVSSLLFRISLLQPDIQIIQRYPHSEWYTIYYGDTVEGDDAAVIEMRKQFEIKNTGATPIYFRSKNIGTRTYAAFIIPGKVDKIVSISKVWKSQMQVTLTQKIYQLVWGTQKGYAEDLSRAQGFSTGDLLGTTTFSSSYTKKNSESR